MKRERPKFWEVFCKRCFSGGIVSDEWTTKRINNENLWPKCCGKIMTLRNFGSSDWKPKEVCSVAICRFATYGICHCSCRGRFHGENNEKKQFHSVQVAPLQWYRQPFSKVISFE